PTIHKHADQAVPLLRAELAKPTLPSSKEEPFDPAWQAVPAELQAEVERAQGLFAERFALCQALPLQRVKAVLGGLRKSGYRPVRLRPWWDGQESKVAVLWKRDRLDWQLDVDLTAEDARSQKHDGMVPQDVAGYRTKAGSRYAILWRQTAGAGDKVGH